MKGQKQVFEVGNMSLDEGIYESWLCLQAINEAHDSSLEKVEVF